MKILAVYLRNLNSLAGSWTIDFTAPEYTASGIFAITGPTGSGKSTILDAICLALFARTPRLGHISKSSNEIMSRRAGDCFAEVEFETRQGRYRCHWGQHRARRSADGELQPPRHEIVDAGTGKVLETRSKEVGRLVESLTGMDYDRFTRSILLAQGDFAAFLDADADQRAPILEQITGTGIYSRISMAVHERTSEERKKTALLQEAMGNVFLLDEAEEKELGARIGEGIAAVSGLRKRLAALDEVLHRIRNIESLREQIAASEKIGADLARRRQEAQEDLLRYDRGLRAQSQRSEYNRVLDLQHRIAALRSRGETLLAGKERLEQEQRLVAKEHALACEQAGQAIDRRNRENGVIRVVRSLDLRLFEKKQTLEQMSAGLRQAREEQRQQMEQREVLERKLTAMAAQMARIEGFFREQEADGLLMEQLTGIRQQLLQLLQLDKDLGCLRTAVQEHQRTLAEAQKRAAHVQQEVEKSSRERLAIEQRQDQQQARLQVLLAGSDAATWRLRIEQGEQRLRQLEKAAELLGRCTTLREEQSALDRSLAALREREERGLNELRALEDKLRIQQQLAAQLEENHQLARQIRSYEEARRHLADGAPCPLCGATHHPWADEEPVTAESDTALALAKIDLEHMASAAAAQREVLIALAKDIEYTGTAVDQGRRQAVELEEQSQPLLVALEIENTADRQAHAARLLMQSRDQLESLRQRVQAVELLEKEVHEILHQREQILTHHADLLSQVQDARHAAEIAGRNIHQLEEQAQGLCTQIDRCRTGLLHLLQPLGITECRPDRADQLLEQLEARHQAWKEQCRHKDNLTREQTTLLAQRDRLDLLLATMDTSLFRQAADQAALAGEVAGLQEERSRLYGDRHPDVEEQQLQQLVQAAEAREVEVRHRLTRLDRDLHALAEQHRAGAEELAALLPQSLQQENAFLVRLPGVGFDGIADFCTALLPPEALAELGGLKDQLERDQTAFAARKTEQLAALAREEEQHQGPCDPDLLLEEHNTLNRELDALQQRIGADRERLAANALRKRRFAEQQLALDAQQREQERWDLLHKLIGSADGKKFRIFAQGLTFDLMISHANRQLRKMNDRYILLRDASEPLALQVIDNYQAGEIRSTRNLSGGESFLVSLSLSLGLSAMASHNVRVDSLFLDEGFGTLDEEALDTALQTLAELRHDGKLIGIISHVPVLKDRIDVRIQVLPGPGGRSRLSGPGCSTSS